MQRGSRRREGGWVVRAPLGIKLFNLLLMSYPLRLPHCLPPLVSSSLSSLQPTNCCNGELNCCWNHGGCRRPFTKWSIFCLIWPPSPTYKLNLPSGELLGFWVLGNENSIVDSGIEKKIIYRFDTPGYNDTDPNPRLGFWLNTSLVWIFLTQYLRLFLCLTVVNNIYVCVFPGKALSNGLINLLTLALVSIALGSGAATFM